VAGRFSEVEWEQFMQLFQRFASWELDQWETWRFNTPHGQVFVRITRRLPRDETENMYTLIAE
jgi:hypothetical protein